MKCEDLDRYLDDYLDDALKVDRAKDVERHLESCPECLNKKDALARLLERLRALPKGVEPFHNLWPEIRERIKRQQAGRSGQVDNVKCLRRRGSSRYGQRRRSF
jgi:anti-sigma factor RsiW